MLLAACGGVQQTQNTAEKDLSRNEADPRASSATPLEVAVPVPSAPGLTEAPSQPDAVAHLPSGCDAAIAVDLAKLSNHAAVAKEIMPRLERLISATSNDASAQRFQQFVKESGLELRRLRGLAVCVHAEEGTETTATVLLDAGLRPGTVVPALLKSRNPSKPAPNLTESGGAQFIGDEEMTATQFADGVVGFGESVARLKLAMKAGDNARAYKLDRTRDLTFFVGKDLVQSGVASRFNKSSEFLDGVEQLTGTADLSTGRLQLFVHASSVDGAKKVDALTTLVKDLVVKEGKVPKQFGADAALKSLNSRLDGSNVILEATFPAKGITDAAKFIGAQLDAKIAKSK